MYDALQHFQWNFGIIFYTFRDKIYPEFMAKNRCEASHRVSLTSITIPINYIQDVSNAVHKLFEAKRTYEFTLNKFKDLAVKQIIVSDSVKLLIMGDVEIEFHLF